MTMRSDWRSHLIARDRKNKRHLLGGLGALGAGEMWFDDHSGGEDEAEHGDAWANAPECASPPPMQPFSGLWCEPRVDHDQG